MDRSKLKTGFNSAVFKNNLKDVFKVFAFNNLVIFFLIVLAYLLLKEAEIQNIIKLYRNNLPSAYYFLPMKGLPFLLKESELEQLIMEEVKYRGPVWILVISEFRLKIGFDFTKPLLVAIAIISNLFWASAHLVILPVFIAGLPLYWLIFKTKSLWTTILCHFLYNISIYIFILLAQYLNLI